ncbi:MAG: hypothetical protein OEV42_15090 [Deltaproteobacteria bacterium]|nr:hypothetical protein [Deltaproteobacteria bacterium]
MSELVGRQYCIENPRTIIRFFGVGVFLGMLFRGNKTLLERAIASYERRGVKMPGPLGESYKLAAHIEFRMARLYKHLARHFRNNRAVSAFFDDLRKEEEEHGRLMLLCLYCVKLNPHTRFSPSARDTHIKEILKAIRDCEKRIDSLSLEDAFLITEAFERSEINNIFGKLLGQTEQKGAGLFAKELEALESHSVTVPRRIRELKKHLGSL